MNGWLLLTTILVTLVTGNVDEWNLIHFSKSSLEIEECLESTEWWNVILEYVHNDMWRQWILDEYSDILKTKTIRVEYINRSATVVVDILRNEFVLNNAQMPRVRVALVRAIMNCSDLEAEELDDQLLGYYNLPRFVQERPEVADLLNYILVDARSLYEGSFDLRTLNSYFRKSLLIILRAVHAMENSSNLMNELQRMWFRRSELFYYYNEYPDYLRHVYLHNRSRPYTQDDPALFHSRRNVPFRVRSPPVENNGTVFEIASFYAINWQNFRENNLYSYSPQRSFTGSQYFIKNLINSFFRFLFFYMELLRKGIVDADNNDDTSPLPRHLIPENLERILYNDTAYDQYLSIRQTVELNSDFANLSPIHISFNRVVGREGRIAEQDLLLMYFYRLMSFIQLPTTTTSRPTTNFVLGENTFPTLVLRTLPVGLYDYSPYEPLTNNATMNTTTPYTASSTTSGYEDSEKRDRQVTPNLSEENSSKSQKQFDVKKNVSDDDNSGPSCTKKFKYSQASVKYYGHIFRSDNQEYIPFEELHNIFSNVLKSELHIHEELSCN